MRWKFVEQKCDFNGVTSMFFLMRPGDCETGRSLEEVHPPRRGAEKMQQHPLQLGAHYYPGEAQQDHRSHRYRSFMIEEILTEHPEQKISPPAAPGDLLKFGVHALLSARPYPNHFVLKAEQNLLKFPVSLGPALGSGLLSGSSSHHLPLDLHLRAKLEPGAAEGLSKSKKGRRSRTVFTELQLMGLEKRFEKQKYLSTPDRIDLAESLGLSQLQVKTWYQNRRMKWKKIVLQGGGLESPTKPKGRPKKNSIPSGEQLSEQDKERTECGSASSSSSSAYSSSSVQSEPNQEE